MIEASTQIVRGKTPLVSVLIPGYNAARFLEETLRSVRRQTLREFEVLMIDDGSTDDTVQIMRRFEDMDPRFHTVICPANKGVVSARNAGLEVASGEFVAFLDADDVWTDDALATRVTLATQYPSALVVVSDFMWFSDSLPEKPYVGRITLGPRARSTFADSISSGRPMLLANPFEATATLHFAWTGATLIRRNALTAIGNFDPLFVGPEDTLVWLRLARRGPFLFTPEVTAFYRQHAASMVAQFKTPKELHYLKVLEHIIEDGLSPTELEVVRLVRADSHEISANHARKYGALPLGEALMHAWLAVRYAPSNIRYWRGLLGCSIDAVVRRSRKPLVRT